MKATKGGAGQRSARPKVTTIVDVARSAGVSTATVSRVLNNRPGVDAGLETRVRETIRELGYQPSRAARTLRTHKTPVWALIVADGTGPFFAEVTHGVEDVAFASDYLLVLCNANEDPAKERAYMDLAVAEEVGGVVLTPASRRTDLSPLIAAGIPVVLVDRTLRTRYADSVIVDNVSGAFEAVAHLLAGGYERVACITGPHDTTTGDRRYVGYCEAMAAAGREVDRSLVRVADFREAGGRRAMRALLDQERRPDAVFVANQSMAVGALQVIDEAGLEIPNDIGIVSFDDMSWSTLLRPPLTAVAQPAYDLGVESARMLLRRLEGYSGAPQVITLLPTLVVRGSSVPNRVTAGGQDWDEEPLGSRDSD